jgi:Transposase
MTRPPLAACFDALGQARCQQLRLVSADAAPWIATVVAERCPQARLCLDPFHVARVGHRRTRPGAPRGLERGPQGRADGPGARAQGCPLCAVEEPWRPDRPPAGQARLDRPGQRPPLPRLPVERRTQAGVHAQGRARHRAAGGVAGLGQALPHPRLRRAGQGDRPASGRHPGHPHPRPVQRPRRGRQHQDPPAPPGSRSGSNRPRR